MRDFTVLRLRGHFAFGLCAVKAQASTTIISTALASFVPRSLDLNGFFSIPADLGPMPVSRRMEGDHAEYISASKPRAARNVRKRQ
jgi:hypothetical protein